MCLYILKYTYKHGPMSNSSRSAFLHELSLWPAFLGEDMANGDHV